MKQWFINNEDLSNKKFGKVVYFLIYFHRDYNKNFVYEKMYKDLY